MRARFVCRKVPMRVKREQPRVAVEKGDARVSGNRALGPLLAGEKRPLEGVSLSRNCV